MIAWLLLGCSVTCPAGEHADSARTDALVARLAGVSDVAVLVASRPNICFGAVESGIDPAGTVHLAEGGDDALAARLAHLLDHGAEIGAFVSEEPCGEQVQRAMSAEAHAIGVEERLRLRWDLPVLPHDRVSLQAAYEARCASARGPTGAEPVQ